MPLLSGIFIWGRHWGQVGATLARHKKTREGCMLDTSDDVYASLRALLPATTPRDAKTETTGRRVSPGPQGPSRRQARTADAIRATLDGEAKGREVGPCENCPHRERCSSGLACASLQLFVQTGPIQCSG